MYYVPERHSDEAETYYSLFPAARVFQLCLRLNFSSPSGMTMERMFTRRRQCAPKVRLRVSRGSSYGEELSRWFYRVRRARARIHGIPEA